MKKYSYIFSGLLLTILISCIKLESTEYQLSQECTHFSKDLSDSLTRMRMEGLHYINVDTIDCVLTIKYEKEKVKSDFFINYLINHKYYLPENLIEENIEDSIDDNEMIIIE